MPKRAFILFLLLVTSFVTGVAAQTAATVSGIVLDPSGAVVPGVTVTAKSGATGLLRTAVTGPEGRYVLAQLPPGLYELRVELAGFKPHVRPEVPLDVAQSLTLNVTLQVGDLAIMDIVTATAPLVNTASSELSYLVTSQQIEQIPLNGRNYTDLALLQPGVNAFPHRDGGSVVAHGLGMS
ncbi:MAG: carboxypeptidase regulatory-like domain-containing protein, partial [Acidobacteria bacterium]|nr:carboxypeptidase regulatory-like domain-containing protein [Acidobacteriota bacterium]